LRNNESQDILLASRLSQSVTKDLMEITPQESLQNVGQGLANRTQVPKYPQALLIGWIELFFKMWCLLETLEQYGPAVLLNR
jgi:hypothetical protein